MGKKTLAVAIQAILSSSLLIANTAVADDTTIDNEDVEHIVVTASGRNQLLKDAPASISVITHEQLQGKAYRDVTDALQDVPGVSIEGGPGRKGGTAEISIRGMSSSYTLILVNGKAQGSSQSYYNGVGGGAEMGWLPPLSAIERIEVIRGPMSSLYGSDALGGVVNVITKKASAQWHGSVSIDKVLQSQSESGDSSAYRYYLGGALNQSKSLGLTLYGSHFSREEDSFVYGYKDHTNDDNNAELYWRVSEGNTLTFTSGFADRDSSGSEDMTGESELQTDRRYYTVSHDLEWGNYNNTQSYAQREIMHNKTQDSRYQRTTINSQSVMPFSSHTITFGGQYREQEAFHPSRAINLALLERWDGAIFVEDEWMISSDFALTFGGRFVDDENYGNKTTPRVYGVFHLNDQFTFKGGISSGYKTPDLKQGTSDWVEGGGGRSIDGADVGNDALKPETSTNYEVAMLWSNNRNMNASLTVYRTDYEDKISKNVICEESAELAKDCVYQGRGYQRVYQYMNEDEAELKGLEASFSVLLGPIMAGVNYTYADTEITSGSNAGEPLNNLPKHMFNISMDWAINEHFKLWSKAKYKSETSEIGAGQYPSYTIVDLGVSYQLNDTVNLYAGAYNLFNKEIRYDEYGKTIDGLNYNAGLRIEF